jgi:hypothetical protein
MRRVPQLQREESELLRQLQAIELARSTCRDEVSQLRAEEQDLLLTDRRWAAVLTAYHVAVHCCGPCLSGLKVMAGRAHPCWLCFARRLWQSLNEFQRQVDDFVAQRDSMDMRCARE